MDRSYLSEPSIVEASRDFVCIRLLTYEDKQEARFLESLWQGPLENTVVGVLDPDGKKLTRMGRSLHRVFGSTQRTARELGAIAKRYPMSRKAQGETPPLPVLANLREAVNVAAADDMPLVVVHGCKRARSRLEDRVRELAWSRDLIGRFLYVVEQDSRLLGDSDEAGVAVVQADEFGLNAAVLARTTKVAEVESILTSAHEKYRPTETTVRDHIRRGRDQGVFWRTVIPVTDLKEQHARSRPPLAGQDE